MSLTYLSVCSGIEAASVAWQPLGWSAVAVAEVEPFPCAVLRHHYPTVPNYGDITRFHDWPDTAFDVLVGGTPCQSFSVAGLRAGLADPRGNLALTFLAVVDRYRPRWVVWENVPGVLSSVSHKAPDPCEPPPPMDLGRDGAVVDTRDEYDADESHAFGCLVAGFSELGYFGAYGTLDAQYFGVAQRRARVFAVFHAGDWHRAAAVLFERESLSGHPAPRREAGEAAPTIPSRSTAGGGLGTDFDCDGGLIPMAYSIAPGNCQTLDGQEDIFIKAVDVGRTLDCTGADPSRKQGGTAVLAVAFDARQSDVIQYGDKSGPLDTCGFTIGVRTGMHVRRLTPRECERLQGFPDDYTLIPYRGKPAKDGPRYKALGNSMAVPVMRWIGERIELVDQL